MNSISIKMNTKPIHTNTFKLGVIINRQQNANDISLHIKSSSFFTFMYYIAFDSNVIGLTIIGIAIISMQMSLISDLPLESFYSIFVVAFCQHFSKLAK